MLNHLRHLTHAIQRNLLCNKKLSPTRMRSRHKTQNIDMKAVILTMTMVNILAFFIVVASGQIYPHPYFGRQR